MKVIKKVVRGFLGSGDEIVTLAVGTYNATRPLFLLLLASILSKENEKLYMAELCNTLYWSRAAI